MIELIILLWIAIKLNAPVWIHILLGIVALIKAVAFGINLSKNNQTFGGNHYGKDKCSNCEYCITEDGDKVCNNQNSEYYSDYVEPEHVCLDYEGKNNECD